MKKIICIMTVMFISLLSIGTFSNANSIAPEYDATFDNGKGIFYANGTTITIDKNQTGDTIVSWEGGQQKVESTVRIIGGGKQGTSFSESNIIMKGGVVSHIYGGGASLDSNQIAIVENSNIVVYGGTVLQTVYGGGLLFTTTAKSNVLINNGIIKSICGGGCASASIAGVTYSAGTVTDLQNSKSRVEDASITINDGIIDTEPSTSGSIFGGGQGYSYVKNSNIIINGGNLSKAYVIGGGSNGYTGNANIKISGGTINILQTVNRGEMNTANVQIDGGSVATAYIGGENDSSVTGVINNVDFVALGGNVTNLLPGISGSQPIIVNQEQYKAVLVKDIVKNIEIGEKEISIEYNFNIVENKTRINKGEIVKLEIEITTNPSGYEYLFNNEKIEWKTLNSNIASIDEFGNLKGINKGKTTILAGLLESSDSIQVEVLDLYVLLLILVIIIGIILLLIWGYIIIELLNI